MVKADAVPVKFAIAMSPNSNSDEVQFPAVPEKVVH